MSRFLRDRSGNMAILFACGFSLTAAIGVVAVDTASLYHERRQIQSAVDLAAISAVSDPFRAAEIAQAVLADARVLPRDSDIGLSVTTGHYDPGGPVIANRFRANATPVNAVRVQLQRQGQLHFGSQLMGSPVLSAAGIAAVTPEVSFSIGSRMASLNGGIANSLLGKLLGTTVSFSVLDYTALASTRIGALSFLDALATQMNVTVGSYDELLGMEARTGTIAAALAGLTSGATRTTLNTLALAGQGNPVPLGKLFSLGELGKLELGSGNAVAGLSLSAMEVLSAAAALAGGDRQVSLALGANVPGLVSLGLDLAIGEPPQGRGWFAFGPVGTVVRTAQLRLRLRAKLLGGIVLLGATVNLPLWLGMASAEARVASATCPTTDHPLGTAVIDVLPGTVSLTLGDLNDQTLRNFGAEPAAGSVRLIDLLLLRVISSGRVTVAQTTPVALSFSSTDIAEGTQRTARTQTPVTSLAASLLNTMSIRIDVAGFGLSPDAILAQAVRLLITPLAPTLDMTINAVFSTLGLGVGEADVRVYGVRCHNAVLVG